ncbi:MAG TPA: SusD/RagB family nutrient-binding outer membrane lipoprotein [Chitinophagales bacterium]|nr:SusD/RagB family nutrient-binding outer membrane lipoprotein [Chitinophagales bacterium]
MKTIKILITVLVITAMFIATSCKKDFFTQVNDNPNSPDSVNPSSLLSTVEGSLGYSQGGELSRFTSMFTQQTLGASRQAQGWYTYIFTTQDFDQAWGNLYAQTMENNFLLMQMSDQKGYHQYAGVSRILMAYTLQLVADEWGSAPFSQAFLGIENLHPSYDADQVLYDSIGRLIDEGIADLNQPITEALIPGPDDFIYAATASSWDEAAVKWIKFGHAIKARLAIHQSKGDAIKAQEALDEIDQSFSGNGDNAQLVFGITSTNAGPWYQFNTQRGDISFSQSTLAAELTATSDPRYPIFIDDANDASGQGLAAYYGSPNSPVEFICYDELELIKAEAILRISGDIAGAQAAYQEAITANMQKLGVAEADITSYIASTGTLPANADDAIRQVAIQAWIILYLNPEDWSWYRRDAAPELEAVDGTEVPRRFLFPQTEYSYNGEHVPPSSLYTPLIFWDN